MANEHRNNPIPYKYACGVHEDCTGERGALSSGLQGAGIRLHDSPESAFACMKASLLRQGYTQLDGRAFSPPDSGEVRILTRPSKFGARLQGGKGRRWMSNAKARGRKARGGIVVS